MAAITDPNSGGAGCASGACTRASDNGAWGCPARMADGRLFTDYRPRCAIQLQFQGPMVGSYDYRQYLTQNGLALREAARDKARQAAQCGPCKGPFEVSTMLPEADKFVCDKMSCQRVTASPGGLGTGRAYTTGGPSAWEVAANDVRKRNAAQAGAQPNCCACGQAPAYYPMRHSSIAAMQQQDVRWAVPGAGAALSGGTPAMQCASFAPV